MRICCAISGFSSMLTLTSLTAPLASRTAFSSAGVSCLQGPHHGAQKSTTTGTWRDASMTSAMKPSISLSLMRSPAVPAAVPSMGSIGAIVLFRRDSRHPGWGGASTPLKWRLFTPLATPIARLGKRCPAGGTVLAGARVAAHIGPVEERDPATTGPAPIGLAQAYG